MLPFKCSQSEGETALTAKPSVAVDSSNWSIPLGAMTSARKDETSSWSEKPAVGASSILETHLPDDLQLEPKLFENWISHAGDDCGDDLDRLAKALRVHDEAKIKNYNDDIDTLLVFAGLFSAVLTAFNIESYRALQRDSGDISAAALIHISHQLSIQTSAPSSTNGSAPAFDAPEFTPSNSAVRINTLWLSSLVSSLVAASLGMLVKQWLREYLTGDYTSPRERIRVRHYRYEGLIKWRVFEMAAIPPLLLQISLLLFFVGLSDFLRQLDVVVGWFITALIILWLLLITTSAVAPIFSFSCPYKLPLLQNVSGWARCVPLRCLKGRGSTDGSFPLFRDVKGQHEKGVRRNWRLDIPAIIGADKLSNDDIFLDATIRPCLIGREGSGVVLFIRKMLEHRLAHPIPSLDATIIDFNRLTTKALATSIHIVVDLLEKTLARDDVPLTPWVHEALAYLFAALDHSYEAKRAIGYAMARGLEIQSSVMSKNASFVREGLTLMTIYTNVPCYFYQLSKDGAYIVITVAQQLVDEGVVNPLELCRIFLSIASLQEDLYVMRSGRGSLGVLLSSLAIAIRRHRFESTQVGSSTTTACVHLVVKLNERIPNFAPDELVETLVALQDPR